MILVRIIFVQFADKSLPGLVNEKALLLF